MTKKETWGKAAVGQTDPIPVQIDRVTLDAVSRSLAYLQENFHTPGAIDKAAFMVSPDELADVIKILEPHAASGEDNMVILMSQDQWSVYSHTVGYVSGVLPKEHVEDAEVLDDLFSQYHDWEEGGFKPLEPAS